MSVINSTSIMLSRWGGFLPCTSTFDCRINNESVYRYFVTCSAMMESPVRGQTYCHCDLALGGDHCEIAPRSAQIVAMCCGLVTLVSIPSMFMCFNELYMRGRNQKLSAAYVSIMISTLFTIFVFLWTALNISNVFGAKKDLSLVRLFQFNVLIPGTLALALGSAMVVMLAWRKVANDITYTQRQSTILREKIIHYFVIFLIFGLVIALCVCLALGNIALFARFVSACNAVGAVLFFISGLRFSARLRNLPPGSAGQVQLRSFRAAVRANAVVTFGMTTVYGSSAGLSQLKSNIGSVSLPTHIPYGYFCIAGVQLGCCIMTMSIVNYGREIRRNTQRRRHRRIATPASSFIAPASFRSARTHYSRVVPARYTKRRRHSV